MLSLHPASSVDSAFGFPILKKKMFRTRSGSDFASAKSGWIHLWILIAFSFGNIEFLFAWEGDLWHFTSFRNVSQWAMMYNTCNIEMDFTHRNIPTEDIPYTLSPTSLPAWDKALKPNRSNPLNEHVLLFFNNPPPDISSYVVSYGFQKNKECLSDSSFNPCLVRPSFGLVRAVVLTAQRTPVSKFKNEFGAEQSEEFVTILNGGHKSEKKFYEAIFLGNARGSDQFRSSHTIDGKSYPMEIYMYFVDESMQSMHAATAIVVLVEEQEEDNPHIKPIIDAVSYHLYDEERKYLKTHHWEFQREQMYHHFKESFFINNKDTDDEPFYNVQKLDSSEDIERKSNLLIDDYEMYQTINSDLKLTMEDVILSGDQERAFQTYKEKVGAYAEAIDWTFILLLNNWNSIIKGFEEGVFHDPGIEIFNQVMYAYKKKQVELKEARLTSQTVSETGLKVRMLQREANKLRDELLQKTEELFDDPYNPVPVPPDFREYFDYEKMYNKQSQLHLLEERKVALVEEINRYIKNVGINSSWEELFGINQKYSHVERDINRIDITPDFEKPVDQLLQKKAKRTGHLSLGNNLGMTEAEFVEYEKRQPMTVQLKNHFQISWLLPKGGGYYFYQGASPVPPCAPTDRTIVFKKPIKMSREQIKTLTVIPTNFDKFRDIRNTQAPLQRLRRPNFPIYFEKRNHQFLRDDGVHKNSVFEYQKRKQGSGSTFNVNYMLLGFSLFPIHMYLVNLIY